MATKKTISDYAAATLAYMDSGKGRTARVVNQLARGYTPAMCDFAAVQTATRLRKCETISAVIAALGAGPDGAGCEQERPGMIGEMDIHDIDKEVARMEREGDQWFYDLRKWREGLRLKQSGQAPAVVESATLNDL